MSIIDQVSKINELSDEVAKQIYSECIEENISVNNLREKVKEKLTKYVGEPAFNETYRYIFSKIKFLVEHSEVKIVKPLSWLREKGYLIKRKGTDWNMPTQKAMDLGLFEIKETTISHSDGHISINKTPKVTGKGQVYFVNKFLGGAISEKTYFKTID